MDNDLQDTEFDPKKSLASLWRVTSRLAIRPTSFFTNLSREKKYWPSAIYILITAVIASAIVFLISLPPELAAFREEWAIELSSFQLPGWLPPILTGLAIILTPVMLLANVGVIHLGVLVFSSAHHKGFNLTWKAVVYVTGFLAIPYALLSLLGHVGIILSLVLVIWNILLLVIGLKILHNTDWWRAALAVIVPNVVAMGLAVVVFAALLPLIVLGGLAFAAGPDDTMRLTSFEEVQEIFGEPPLVPTELPSSFRGGEIHSDIFEGFEDSEPPMVHIAFMDKDWTEDILIFESVCSDDWLPDTPPTEVDGVMVYDMEPYPDAGPGAISLGAFFGDVWVEIDSAIPRDELLNVLTSMEPTTGDSSVFKGEWPTQGP